MDSGELRRAFWAVWVVTGAIVLAILATPWIATAQQVGRVIPSCQYKQRYRRQCFLCGMTTAFYAISRGDFLAAERANRGSVPLYGMFLVNELTIVLVWRERSAC